MVEPDERDRELLKSVIFEFCSHFSFDPEEVLSEPFIKLFPLYLRPYGPLYAPTHRGAQGPVRRSRL